MLEVVVHRRSLGVVLDSTIAQLPSDKNIPLMKEMSYGTLRWYFRLRPLAQSLLFKPLESKHQDVFYLLLVGLYQLIYLNLPDYAVVSETVSAVKALKKPWASGLINKLLRRFLSEKERLLGTVDRLMDQRYAHPGWLVDHIKAAWPDNWVDILAANNTRAPMTLRVNSLKTTTKEYIEKLACDKIVGSEIDGLSQAIMLESPRLTRDLPDFSKGACYVQDASGQFAADLLDLKKGHHVLDACAAPGSKTTHIIQTQPDIKKLVAIDANPQRLKMIKENVERLNLPHHNLHLILSDAAHTQQWWSGEQFDRILLDPPCSATGVIRRHPDIKVLRKKEDIAEQAVQQMHLLKTLWPLLKKEGVLLYSTCSILPEENEKIISKFLSSTADAKVLPFSLPCGIKQTHGYQLLPEVGGHDGFYFSRLKKT